MSSRDFRFGTVGSPISTPKKPGGSVGGVFRIAELDLNCLELGWVRSVRVSEQTCKAIKDAALENDIAISVHAPYYINLNAKEDEWPKSRQRLMDSAHYGNLAGATDIVFHPGSYFDLPREDVLPKAIERLHKCIDELRTNGNEITLRPETMGKSAMMGSLEDTLEMSVVISGVEPCLDFAHLHARSGDGSMNTYEEWCRVLELYAERLGENSLSNLHIHLSGIEYGEKGEKEHLEFDKADIDLKSILKALKTFNCAGRILCESPILEDDALVIKKTWDDLIDG
ncbi:MAG: TIM barrel protein [Anaerolineales bacterium]|nr:TIM barrel protein [Anaerolineales bacterium]